MRATIILPGSNVLLVILVLLTGGLYAQTTNITGPPGSGQFGYHIVLLSNGNYVIADPFWDNGGMADVGAVYLYNGATNTLISTLTGSSTGDHIGINGITALPNGNFVIRSDFWSSGGSGNCGAVTWCSGTTGLNGVVSSANSIIGNSINDQAGSGGITVLTNGNYIVASPAWHNGAAANAGAFTWCSGTSGRSGIISSANSLTGSKAGDALSSSVMALTNDNYVVSCINWDNGTVTDAGAVTWGSGSSGISGIISTANSLAGSSTADQVGVSIAALSNGNYVAGSPGWNNGGMSATGAATWCNGTSGTTGTISVANSLIGDQSGDRVGHQLTALTNGNYIVRSKFWDNAAVSNAGAVTWGNGTTGIMGIVTTANSLVGSLADDQVGLSATALTNGNYVVYSPVWDAGTAIDAGAVTWGNGTTPITGAVSIVNSFVGSSAGDQLGLDGVITLTNGNYVISSSLWSNGGLANAGAVTWGNGITGITGTPDSTNSLVGMAADDYIGLANSTALTNGNYVAGSYNWHNGVGAFRLCNGTTGTAGTLNAGNSLVGSSPNDLIGASGGIKPLQNGNYVVASSAWNNGAIEYAGAATWCSGTIPTTGPVSVTNSLVGGTANDLVGIQITPLTNGNYVVNSGHWANGAITNAGAITWGNGTTGTTGLISIANSLVGSHVGDYVGLYWADATVDGNYITRNYYYHNGSIYNAGAATFANGMDGITGIITTCNSVIGENTAGIFNYAYDTVYDQMIVGRDAENIVSIFNPAVVNSLVTSSVCNTAAVATGGTTYRNSCNLIAKVLPAGSNPVSGSINACATLDATQQHYNAEPYVQRHYDIEPATANTNTTSATITLYFTDGEFSAFNTNNPAWPKLPTVAGGGNSDPNRSNLKITQYHGTATISPSQPGMYSAGLPGVYINPNDNDIIWNGYYWAITFNVLGFSGFYVHSNPIAPLRIAVNYFRGTKNSGGHLLDWKLNCDGMPGANIILERSNTAAGSFTGISSITTDATRCNQPFNYTDAKPLSGMNYYRLKITDDNGEINYSNIVALLNADKGFEIAGIVPNPVIENGLFKLNISSAGATVIQLNITDAQGRVVMKTQKNIIAGYNSIDMNVTHLAKGTYYISAITGDDKRKLVRFVKQ